MRSTDAAKLFFLTNQQNGGPENVKIGFLLVMRYIVNYKLHGFVLIHHFCSVLTQNRGKLSD